MSHLLKDFFPEDCIVHYVLDANAKDLMCEEKDIIKNYGELALTHFCMGRLAAHQCLEEMGCLQPIGKGEKREPLWPKNVVGSITHTKNIAFAVIGSTKNYLGLGIDCERLDRKLNPELATRFTTSKEQAWLCSEQENSLGLLKVLSAKEAVFKAFFPLESIYLGFLDAELEKKEWGFSVKLLKKASDYWELSQEFQVIQKDWGDYLISFIYLEK